jgi:membrane associated rhomboid family serine protease
MTDQTKFGFLGSIPAVTKNLIIINFLCWLASLVLPRFGIDLIQLFGLHFLTASDFHFYQLFTYMFLHATPSLEHVFFNMFAVFMFGRVLENVWGKQRFLFFYLVTGIGAAVMQEIVWFYMLYADAHNAGFPVQELLRHPGINNLITIGASGAVFGILLAFGMLFPNTPLFIMFIPIPIKAKYFVAIYGVIELFLGVANFNGDNVAHFAHLGGMLFGFFIIRYWKKKDFDRGLFY